MKTYINNNSSRSIGVLQKINVIYQLKYPLGDCISENNNIYIEEKFGDNEFIFQWELVPPHSEIYQRMVKGEVSLSKYISYLPTPPLGQDMTQGQFLSEV